MDVTYRYYHGETECPSSYKGTPKEAFWNGERMFAENADVEHWIDVGKEVRASLDGIQLYFANKYTDVEFGIIVFIEQQYSAHDPYDNMRWIYDY